MLLGKQADVYFTGEMSHVSASPHHRLDRPKGHVLKVQIYSTRFWLPLQQGVTSSSVSLVIALHVAAKNPSI